MSDLYEWNEIIQKIINWIEENLEENHSLARATFEIRDTNKRLLDIAVKYGYSSHEALTRAFVKAYGCTPSAYRQNPVPLPISIRQVVYFPGHYTSKGEQKMNKTCLTQANIRIEYIPEHKYIGIWDKETGNYMDFWKTHDCDTICGIIDSMSRVSHPVVTCQLLYGFLPPSI